MSNTILDCFVPFDFNPEGYVRLNPDVLSSGIDPTSHFLQIGARERRRYRDTAYKLGIAVITCDRYPSLKKLIQSILQHTASPYEIAIFNDSKEVKSAQLQERMGVRTFGDQNRGVVWNKNRALYYFSIVNPVDIVILIEDDVLVVEQGWESKWIESAALYGQINTAPPWFYDSNHNHFHVVGSGTVFDPGIFKVVTGQCTAVMMELVKRRFGYMDSRFVGYGYGHVEWTNRFVASNYGGTVREGEYFYLALRGDDFDFISCDSYRNSEEVERNRVVFSKLGNRASYVDPPQDMLREFVEMKNMS